MRKIVRWLVLGWLTRLARRRLPPAAVIIGITGSVGKTTAKEAAAKILAGRWCVLATPKSFNSEFGVPLTLLELPSARTAGQWLQLLAHAWRQSRIPLVAEKIVLEMGVDRPGDMATLLKIVRPTVGVLTAVAPVHLAAGQFTSVAEIAAEKQQLLAALPPAGAAIWNADDPRTAPSATPAETQISFGLENPADLTASQIRETATGLAATLQFAKQRAELTVPLLGRHNLYPLLAAIAIGLSQKMPLSECAAALADFRLPPGRGNLLAGIAGSVLLDSSYNSNPASLAAALNLLATRPGRRLALLGQMNELGKESAKLHAELAEKAVASADEIYGVHGDARIFVEAARAAGRPARFFATAAEAGEFLRTHLQAGDTLLAKGSQNNVRLEKALAKLLAHPADRQHLPRQDAFWHA